MLLIYPPITKGCEPPGGLPILGAALKSHNIKYQIIDMNIGAQNYLLDKYYQDNPKKAHYRDLIRDKKGYSNPDRYKKVVNELNRGLSDNWDNSSTVTLSNYTSDRLSPLKSKDLIESFRNYKYNTFYNYYKDILPKLINSMSIKYIGISIQFLNQAICSFALIGYIKDNYPDIKIIIGGGLVTSWVKKPNWNNPFNKIVDKIISGPGEIELLKYLGCNVNPDLIKNTVPDYDFIHDNKYFSPGNIIPISASLGCSWSKCTFCPEKAENNPYIPVKTPKVIDNMKVLKKRYKPFLFHFLDNEMSPSLLRALSQDDIGVPWYGFTKFYSSLKDLNFCKSLKSSGCIMLKLGLESGDQRVLDSINKGIDINDVELILYNLKASGIKTFIYILFGTPSENLESARKTKIFLKKHKDCITYLNLAIFNLPIGSSLAKKCDTTDFFEADLSLYTDFNHPLGWNRDKIRSFLKNEFKSDPELKEILLRTPLQFSSNHSVF